MNWNIEGGWYWYEDSRISCKKKEEDHLYIKKEG